MVIGICGFGYSGSGAVWDLLKEYSDCVEIGGEREFVFTYMPDGIDDLKFHLNTRPARFQSSDVAIRRFKELIDYMNKDGWGNITNKQLLSLTDIFLDKLIQVKWEGTWSFDKYEITKNLWKYLMYRIRRKKYSLIKRYTSKEVGYIKAREMCLSVMPENFDIYAREYISSIINSSLDLSDTNKSVYVLNQPFPANAPLEYFNYFDNPKAIIVTRDPRDIYLTVNRVQVEGSRWIPQEVTKFVKYYKALHSEIGVLYKNDNVLVLAFEDLVYHYDNAIAKIEAFLPEIGKHIKKKVFFDPQKSIQNTQLYRYFTNLKNDIEYIERELKEFLYDFDETLDVKHDTLF